MATDKHPNVSDIKFDSIDFEGKITVREYLKQLLKTLWREGDGFSSKRPFGNGGWQYDIYNALNENGLIDTKSEDYTKADQLILDVIDTF